MDKRLAYIVLGLLVIFYLVCRRDHPEILQQLQTKAVAVVTGKTAPEAAKADPEADQWEKHRQEVFGERFAESKRRAVAKYPALAQADSEMNIRFVNRYKLMVKDNNPRLKAPNWPELLADDCAAAVAEHAPANMVANKSEKAAHAGTAQASVVIR